LVLLILVSYIVWGLARATIHKYRGAGMNLIASLVFVATVWNDILHYSFIVTSIDLVTLGLFVFTFTQMFMLAQKFSSAFHEAERLKEQLEGMNEQLEAIVAERTRALHKTNEKLIEAEGARKNMMSNILHELGNPMTLIM